MIEQRLASVQRHMNVLTWMMTLNLVLTAIVVVKVFEHC